MPTEPITANAIAKKIKRSRICVARQIQKMDIKPEIILGGLNYYAPEVADDIAEAMRAPNKDGELPSH